MNDLMTKSFVSYVDLKKSALKDLESDDSEFEAGIEMMRTSADENLRRFFLDAELVKEEMNSIKSLLFKIQESNKSSKTLRAHINSDIVEILKKARAIQKCLEGMDRANGANRRLSGYREGTPIDRTRTSVTNGLRKKLKELMMEFQGLRQRTMAEYKETVERRYFAVTGEVPGEDLIEKIVSDGGGEDVLKKAVAEHGRGKVLETVHEIKDRHGAAKEIEKGLLELHRVFLEMAVVVETQGEEMDDIEHNVTRAKDYVKGGTEELRVAKGYQRSGRKWFCVGVVLLLVLVLLVVVPVVASLHKG